MKPSLKKKVKRVVYALLSVVILIVGIVVYANWKIPHDAEDFVFDDVEKVPAQQVALILGTSPVIGSRPNLYFVYRIRAAKELYEAGKVNIFVVSGDNSRKEYNEPQAMKKALMAEGIPEEKIYLDYAGFRTLDSVVRMNKIFGQESFVVVSQQFHNERAVFLAQHYGLAVYGYNAKDLDLNKFSVKTKVREKLARVKVFVDISIGKSPKFLGEPVIIDYTDMNLQ